MKKALKDKERNIQDLTEEVMETFAPQLQHPIMVDKHNVCELVPGVVRLSKLGTFPVKN